MNDAINEPKWGLPAPEGVPLSWGARAIFRDGGVDCLWDRQGVYGGTDEERKALCEWINNKGMPMMRHLAKSLSASDNVEEIVEGDGYRMKANPRRSYGYLYLCAYPCAEATGPTPTPPKPKPARKSARKPLMRRASPPKGFI